MPVKPTSDKVLRDTARTLRKVDGNREAAAKLLGLTLSGMSTRVKAIRARLPNEKLPDNQRARNGTTLTPEQCAEAAAALEAAGGNISDAARSLGLHRATYVDRLRSARVRDDWQPVGRVGVLRARPMPLPKGDAVARYILTCAQSGTKLHEPTWKALNALAEHYGARLLVSTFSYSHRQEGSAKRGTQVGEMGTDWYDPRIEPSVCDDMVAVAPSLIFNGHMNILPTAIDPLSGMSNYNGRNSSIFPHAKVAMQSVPTMAGHAAKMQYTTGAATQINYIQKKAGQKAEFDHVFGGLLVEVNSAGEWWARQLVTDSRGRMYDLDVVAMPEGEVVPSVGSAALVFGDLHAIHLVDHSRWADGGMVDVLRPDVQVAHDILDFESRSHHNRRDPHKMFELHARGRESVEQELVGVGGLLRVMAKRGRVLVVNSNHDRHLERWLKEADWRTDPVNARFFIECQRAFLQAIEAREPFDALKWAVQKYNPVKGVRFLAPGNSYVVCRDRSGGVELGLHGDLGPGGARGSIRNLSRLGRKVVIGHSHSAGIFNGAYQVGVSADMNAFSYARGAPGAWSHTDCVVYANGKRALITWHNGKWRA